MFPIGTKVICLIQVLIRINRHDTFIYDSKAEGKVIAIQDNETIIVNFSNYTNKMNYTGDYTTEPVFQKNCVPIID